MMRTERKSVGMHEASVFKPQKIFQEDA